MQDYVADDVVMIWHLEDDVAVDDADILYVKRMNFSRSHKYRYRALQETDKCSSGSLASRET
jgi:hypothetical protein